MTHHGCDVSNVQYSTYIERTSYNAPDVNIPYGQADTGLGLLPRNIHRFNLFYSIIAPFRPLTRMDSSKFGILPGTAQKGAVSPFAISIPDAEIERLRALLAHSKIPSACYENALPDGSRTLGLRRAWLVEAQRVWETEFNW